MTEDERRFTEIRCSAEPCAGYASLKRALNDAIAEMWDARQNAVIAWSVCASVHRQFGKGRDTLYITRQADFVKHEADARAALSPLTGPAELSGRSNTESSPDKAADPRECTCRPDDNPPRPCPRKFAYSECVKAPAAVADYTERAQEIYDFPRLISRKNKARADGLYYEVLDRDTMEVLGAFGTDYEAQDFERDKEIERIATALFALAAEHQAALRARLGEPEMREALRSAFMGVEGWSVPSASSAPTHVYVAGNLADAALAVITEMLT